MEVEFLVLADAAQVAGGKLYMLGGGWTIWRAPSYPARASFSIAAGFRIGWDETDMPHPMEIQIHSPDGREILRAEGRVQAGRPQGVIEGSSQLVMLAVSAPATFETAGPYELSLTMNGEVEWVVPFDCIEAT